MGTTEMLQPRACYLCKFYAQGVAMCGAGSRSPFFLSTPARACNHGAPLADLVLSACAVPGEPLELSRGLNSAACRELEGWHLE
jgi:hypothetical protein